MANGNDSTTSGRRMDSYHMKSPKKKPGVYHVCPVCESGYLSENKKNICERNCKAEAKRTRKERTR